MFDIKRFCEDHNLRQADFGNIIGVEQSVVSNMTKGIRHIRLEHIERLREAYGNVVDNYRTEGPSAVKPATMSPLPTSTMVGQVSDVRRGYDVEEAVIVEQPPIIPDAIARKADLDLLEWAESSEAEHSKNAFDMLDILKKTKFIVKTTNNAMAPALYQNELVFLKPLPENTLITDGEPYGIDTRNRGILVRYLYDKGDYYLARPKNRREYSDIEIPKNMVIRKYVILFHGSTLLSSVPNTDIDLAQRDKQISQQGTQITSLINQLDKSGSRVDRLITMLERREED